VGGADAAACRWVRRRCGVMVWGVRTAVPGRGSTDTRGPTPLHATHDSTAHPQHTHSTPTAHPQHTHSTPTQKNTHLLWAPRSCPAAAA
jgi:hypothetical protein